MENLAGGIIGGGWLQTGDLIQGLHIVWQIWSHPILLCSFLFYFIFSNVTHVVADLHYPPSFTQIPPGELVQIQRWVFKPLAEWVYRWCHGIFEWWSRRHEECILKHHQQGPEMHANLESFHSKRHEVIQSWIMSFIHAIVTALLFAWAFLIPPHPADEERLIIMFMHTCGYFLADTIVNPSVMFALHHLCPLPFLHCLILNGSSLEYAALSLGWAEVGNTFAHAATLWTCKSGLAFQRIRAVAFWLSRPISMTYAYLAFSGDVPEEYHGTWKGHGCFMMFLAVAGVNAMWMLVMIAPAPWRAAAMKAFNGTSTVKLD